MQFVDGKIYQFIATSEIIGDLYERGYKECQSTDGNVNAIAAPIPHDRELITHDKKLMILGAGRSGTTFLVKLLTRLDLYTGYSPYNEIDLGTSRAGCEFGVFTLGELRNNINSSMTDLEKIHTLDETHTQAVFQEFKAAPFIIKCPTYSWYTKLLVFHYRIPFGHILVPVRDHREVAKSRIGEGLQLPIIGSSHNDQIIACDVLLGKVVEAAVLADIPLTFMRFPDIVTNEPYCWSKVNSVLSETYDIHLDRNRFRNEFYNLSDPSMIKYSPRKLEKVKDGSK
jgi:hypothetical protein